MTNMFLLNELILEVSAERLQKVCDKNADETTLDALKESAAISRFVYTRLCRDNLNLAWKANDSFLGLEDLPEDVVQSLLHAQDRIIEYILKCLREALPVDIVEEYLELWADSDGYIGMIDAALQFGKDYYEIEFRMIW